MTGIIEFLEARIAEDEAVIDARGHFPHSIHSYDPVGAFSPNCPDCLGLPGKARVIAECAAKRAIIEQAEEASSDRSGVINEYCVGDKERAEAYATDPGKLILEALAAVYKDHPDYQQEWDV